MRPLGHLLLASALSCAAWSPTALAGGVTASRVEYVMGTMLEVQVHAADSLWAAAALNTAFAEVHRLDSLLSNYREDSEISRMIRHAPGPVPVNETTFTFVKRTVEFAALTGGAFDPTVGAVVALWGFDSGNYRIPDQAVLQDAVGRAGYKHIHLDTAAQTIALEPGVRFDPGASGKGFALARAGAKLRAMGVSEFYFDFGGQVYREGTDTVGIAIRDPRFDSVSVSEVFFTTGSVATSGDYERYFERNGKRYAHIIDPRSGFPVADRYAVSVYAEDPWIADALSTALFVLGPNAGSELLACFPGVGALYIERSGEATRVERDSLWQRLEIQ